jgi:hypothetical protein
MTSEERWAKMSANDLRRELARMQASHQAQVSKLLQEIGRYRGLAESLRDFLNVDERRDCPQD